MSTAAKPPEPEKPRTFWGIVVTATPIVLTIVATLFASLSSSEMMQSMAFRSLAAQHQAKAGDQWAFFQAKRIRGTSLETTIEILQSPTLPPPFTASEAREVLGQLRETLQQSNCSTAQQAATKVARIEAALLREYAYTIRKQDDGHDAKVEVRVPGGLLHSPCGRKWASAAGPQLPTLSAPRYDKHASKELWAVVQAIDRRKTEEQTASLVRRLTDEMIATAVQQAEEDASAFDDESKPFLGEIREVRKLLTELAVVLQPFRKPVGETAELFDRFNQSFKVQALSFDAGRYRQEAEFNLATAQLLEVRVRHSAVESDRHRWRSFYFLAAMLLAQVGVVVASLALAKVERAALWVFAALSGFTALAFGGYVFTAF